MKNYHNIRSSFGNDNTVYTTNGVVQDLKELSNTHWLDAVGTRMGVQYEKYVYDFDGVNSKIDTNIFPPTLTGEVEMRIKITQEGTIFSNRSNSSNYFEVLGGNLNDSLITIDLKESPNQYIISSNFINDGDWHKINIRYTGFSLYIYIDDLLDKVQSSLTLISSNLDKLFIGCRSNSSHFVTMQLAEFKWKSLQNIILIWYKCEEQTGTIAYDSSGFQHNGSLLGGITHTTARNNKLINYTNLVGYSTLNNVIIPRDESNTNYDVLGNLLQNNGEVANNVKLINSNALEVDTTTEAQLNYNATTLMITSYGGTSIPTLDVNNNKITFTDGIIYDLKLFDYAYGVQIYFPLAEGSGSTSYSIDNGYTLTWINTHNWTLQDEYHYNIINGFSTDNAVRLPFMHLKVEDYPLLWINQNYYYNYKDNIFKVPYQLDQSVWVGDDIDYDAVQMISLSNKSLNTDFTPTLLNKFQNLTTLDISSNNITNIDLSNNLNLQNIRVGYNKVTSYDLTNLSNLPSVTYFDLQGSIAGYEVNNIYVNHLTTLTALVITGHHISNIDISNLTNLNWLGLANNSSYLTSIDVSNNTLLDSLILNNNSLSTIDLSNNPNIYYLKLDYNNLTSLDISNNSNLVNLTINDNLINSAEHEIILEDLVNHNKNNGLFKSNVYNGYLTPQSIDYVNTLLSRNWTIQTLQTTLNTNVSYNIEDFPLIWINDEYYNTYKDNTFQVSSTTPMTGFLEYNAVTELKLNDLALNTDFSNNLLSKLPNINNIRLENNNISTLDISSLNYLDNVTIFNNNLDELDNSQILIDLDNTGLTDGYLKTNISTGLSLTNLGEISYNNLFEKNWYMEFGSLLNLYPNAKSAHSLFLLDDNYTGPCINVRRDIDNATLDIGFDGKDLDITTLETFCNPNFLVDVDMDTDTNGDGMLDVFLRIANRGTPSLVTGNGHIGQAQRLDGDATGLAGIFSDIFPPIIGQEITISFMYRSNVNISLTNGASSTQFPLALANTGNAIRYQETRVFNPTSGVDGRLTFSWLNGVSEWYEISDLSVTVHTADGYVTTWYDQSGNSYDAVQLIAASQPKIVSGGSVITQYGKPAIEYNGTTTWLQANNMNVTDESKFSQLFVVKNTTAGTAVAFSGAAVLTDNQYSTSADDITFGNTEGLYVVDNINVKGYLNSIDVGSTGPTFTQIFNRLYFGSTNGSTSFAAGTIQAAILYDFSDDQSTNRVQIERMLNNYYGIYPQGNRLLNYYRGAQVAYSLMLLNANYTGAAVNVRRGMDNATLDVGFVNNELDIVALEAFCQPNTITYQSDFTAGNEAMSEFNGISTDGETIAGVSDAYKFELTNGFGAHQTVKVVPEDYQRYSVTFDYYIPSTNSTVVGLTVTPTDPGPVTSFTGTDQWLSASVILSTTTFARLRIFAFDGVTTNIDADGDVFYIKNLVITQLTSNGYVTTWYDQSGNGSDATQTVSSSQPQIVSNGSVILENGKPAIEAIDIFNALTTPFTSAAQMTTVAVSRLYDISANRYITDSASGRYIVGAFSATQKYTAFRSTALSGDTAQTTKNSLYFATFDGANSTITNDAGTTYTGDAGTSTFTTLRLMTGLGNGFNGNVQSIIIYNSDQSSNRSAIEDVLNNYYNIY